MSLHVMDDRHQVEARAADPVAQCATIEMDALPLEDLGLPIERQMITEFRDDDPGDEEFRGQTAGHDMFRRMRLRHGLRAAAAGIFRAPRDQHPELGRNHVEPLRDVFPDLRHLATAAGAERAGGLDHPFDPGQMRRQMPAVALWLAGCFPTRPLHCRFGLLLSGLEHALRKFGIFQGEVELAGRELFGALAELLALRCVQDILQPPIGLLRLGQRRLDLGEAGFQQGIFARKISGFHEGSESQDALSGQ
ncbi:hypothetical protein ABIE69_003470 [Rhodobacteraceae bacterium MBR-64]